MRNNCASDPNGVCKKDNVTGSIVLGLGENVANVSFIDFCRMRVGRPVVEIILANVLKNLRILSKIV